jgi:hypothetical protein
MIGPAEETGTQSSSGESSWKSKIFLDLREVEEFVAIRVRPKYAQELWEHLRFSDPTIAPLDPNSHKSVVYLERSDGAPYLDGDLEYTEILTKGTLQTVTARIGPFLMTVAGRIMEGNKNG